MRTELAAPVNYSLLLNDEMLPLNPVIGHELRLSFTGTIHCIHCGRRTKKSFNQGYCYPCFTRLAQCDSCIVKPEKCHYDQGTCREPQWGETHCFQPHYVYLANSSGLKVGITRHNQIPTRWIDQGAVAAVPVMRVTSRQISGLMEVSFKDYVADKTSWQKMLKGVIEPVDMLARRDELLEQVQPAMSELRERFGTDALALLPEAETVNIEYPVLTYPTRVKSFNFDKDPLVQGILQGIKGQYLIFDKGVINLRKFGGYEVTVEYG
ncbi:MAG: hypothetical protein CSA79_02350 [Thiothrix nivea]|nr:MAG: hypothetical protein CSA79_02350 [Thiothrix nivea]